MNKQILSALTLLSLIIPAPAYALGSKKAAKIPPPQPQETQPVAELPQPEPKPVKPTPQEPEPEEPQKPKEKRYQKLTRATLSQLYWAMDQMDPNRDSDIDNFLMINKCDLYKQSFNDDFAWHEIRQKARASLIKHKDNFSKHIEIIQPIALGRYNVTSQTFPLTTPIVTSSFEIKATDEEDFACRKENGTRDIWRYPHRAIMHLAKPLNLKQINVPIELAGIYNTMHTKDFGDDARPAFLVKKLRVFEAFPRTNDRRYRDTAKINAVLETIEIYGDKQRTLRLYSENMRKRDDAN